MQPKLEAFLDHSHREEIIAKLHKTGSTSVSSHKITKLRGTEKHGALLPRFSGVAQLSFRKKKTF
jgi:hypothetical protein